MSSNDHERKEWEQLVGKAISSFAEIELITYHWLRHIPRDDIFRTASGLPFGRRVDLILGILDGLDDLPNIGRQFQENLRKAVSLAEVRNLIAHNPTMLEVYEHQTSGELHFERTIRAIRKQQKFLDLEGLKKYTADVETLASGLWMNIGKLIEWHETRRLPG